MDIQDTNGTTSFHGIRKDVTAEELLKCKIIDQKQYEDLRTGKVTIQSLSEIDSVHTYLQGTNSIAGVFLQSSKQVLSICEAKLKGLLTPGTALVLLEAQAATGFMIDPVTNRKLSVEEAVTSGLVGADLKQKLLSAERGVTGYTDPNTGDTISLFQALQKELIVKDHGIRLLEAQIATGGIIDPVFSHRVPVEVAYQRGYFDEKMNQILLDPSDDTKGFFDPNTQENLTYLQLVERCVTDPKTGLSLLVIVQKGEDYFFFDEKTKKLLKSTIATKTEGKTNGQGLSVWEFLYSKHITEEKRRELVRQYSSGEITMEHLIKIIVTITEEKTSCTSTAIARTNGTTNFHGIRKDVTAEELLKCKIIDQKQYEDLRTGKVTIQSLSEIDSVHTYLQGTNSIAGVFLQSSKQVLSICEAKLKGLLTPGTALVLLEAQAATGFMIDPVTNRKLSVEEAVTSGLVGADLKQKLLSAERGVTGYTDPNTGDTISLFQALQKELIVKDHGIRLLEAQIATGGIIDPVFSHRVPVEVAYQRGYFDEKMNQILLDPSDDTKGFFDPNTQENLTYLQLVERCVTDPKTGLSLLVIVQKGEDYFFFDEKTKKLLKSTIATKTEGKTNGQGLSVWEFLYSKHITEEKRRELVRQYSSGEITMEHLIKIIVTITEEKTSCTSTAIARTNGTTNFHGIRKDVTAEELLKCKIIDQKQYEDLRTGKVTIQSLSEIDSVHTYLQGTNSIAGVFLQSSKQVLSICEAKLKGLLTPGTALVLLEAQAATGFMIDPVTNRKLSVEEAVTSGLVGADLKQKLLSAERGVTGYIDPNTGDTISLFQALQKELIVKDHGIRLLEAQIATGGIIDPVFSHRVPVEVAYQRGYFDEKMNQILLDPSDDTKGFFDPNTQENLTYLQLVERCVTDPKTGLSLLVIVQKGEDYFFFDEKTKKLLKSTIATKTEGKTNGQGLSVWEFLYSKHITEEKRRELVRQYSSGEITMEHLIKIIVTITEEKTSCTSTAIARTNGTTNFHGIRKDVTAEELLKCKIIDQKQYEDLRTGKVTIQSLSEIDSVHTYLQGTNSIAGVFLQSSKQVLSICEAKLKGLLTPGTALVLLEAQAATGFMIDPVTNRKLSVEEAVTSGLVGADLKQKLLSAERGVTGYIDPNTGDTISLFQALQKELIVKDHGIRLLEAQIATGGIIDPVFSHRVPVEVAYQRGYFDEKMNQILLDPSDDTKGFFDPNTQENLTYLQLVERCVTDPKTGLSLLVIVQKGEDYFFFDEKTKKLLKSTIATKTEGKTNGQGLSVWEFLYSKHITEEKRRELVRQYSSGEITMEHLIKIIVTITEEKTSCTSTAIARTNGTTNFHGIRKDVTAEELLKCKIIDQKQYEDLRTGKVTIQSLSEIDSVHTYLQGTNSIAGVFLQSSKQVLSICEAKLKGLLTPGTALVLLEAQAATGFMIDPVTNRKLSVEEAVTSGLVGADLKQKLLSAERGVTGYIDPNTGDTISLFQALQKELIVKDHGIRLLEAQIATGGIIDPVFSHRVPVEVAYQRGYFDEKMNQILLDPSDDTKGFFDPNTQENLTYLQLVERCVTDPKTGLSLLVIVQKGEDYFFFDEKTKKLLKSTIATKTEGKTNGQGLSVWEFLYSKHITEEKRRELVRQYSSGEITMEHLIKIIVTITEEKTSCTSTAIARTNGTTNFHGIRKDVTAEELLKCKIIDQKQYEDLRTGKVTIQSLSEIDSVHTYLQGTNSIAGVFLQSSKQVLSICEAKLKGLLTPGTALVLLEAQAATGFMIDPVTNRKLSVEEAVTSGLVGADLKQKLLSAERGVTGYIDPNTGDTISLFQALQKELIVKDHGIRLLEAQIATGGIIDPVFSHRVPVEVAYQRGYFDEKMNQILLDPSDDTKGFFDPNTQENLTYLQLVERCVTDPKTGLSLLVIVQKGEDYFFFDEKTKKLLKSTIATKTEGKTNGQGLSVWEFLYSKHITEEKRRELVRQYSSGEITMEHLIKIIVTITEEKTSCTSTAIARTNGTTNFHGIRKDVTAEELLKCKIIDQKQYEDLRTGKVTIQSLSEIDSVHTYLQGTNSIAGVFLQSSKQVLSICEAKLKGLLTPGTALVLLEAQAATGFMIDPVTNRKLSVEEAVTSGLVGADLKQKLLSAERGVTGYTDPNTGDTISLFQALQKELIVKDHGIRLLEAQIATGGIIDPVFSHRVPVEVAYQRGYFDEKMNQILLDPSDDTKGFFDPNTQENLTYLQLVERCVTDPKTGLSLLVIVQKGEDYFFFDEKTKKLLKSTIATKTEGKTNGQGLSVWEFLYSKHITEEKRRELVRQYSSGEITMEHLIKIIVTITEEKTSCTSTAIARTNGTTNFHGIRKDVTAEELLKCKIIDQKQYEDLRTGKVTIQSLSEIDSVHTYLQGTNSIAGVFLQSSKQVLSICEAKLKGLLTPGTALVLLEAQAATGFMIDPVTNRKLSVEEAVTSGLVGADLKQKLLSAERGVTGYIDPNTGDTISLFQALQKELIVKDHGIRLLEAQIATGGIIDPVFSHRVPVEVAYQRGYFDEKMNQILLDPSDDTKGFFDPNTQENLTYLQLVERCVTDPKTGLSLLVIVQKGEDYFFFDEKTKKLLKSTIATKTEGKTNGQGLSVWEFLYSKHITEEKRRELVRQYSSGEITMEHLIKIIVTITEEKTSCTSTAIARTNGTTNFHGIRKDVTAEELLKCKIIDQKQYEDLRTGKVTIQSLSEIDSVHTYLQGTNSIAGVFLQSSKQVLSICEAKLKGLLTPGTALVLLEAQAATGFMIDPVTNRKLSVEEAVTSGLVGADLKQKLLSAEMGVTGYTDPNTGDTISLFQALQKELIVKDHGIRLLEAQIATGGIIDPVFSHRVPVEVAYQRGYFDEKMNQILLDPSDDTKGFFDPNTQENLTYLQLVERCVTDPKTGLSLLVIVQKGEDYFFFDEKTKKLLKSTIATKTEGKTNGQGLSVWEFLYSKHITEEKRRELVRQYSSGEITMEHLIKIIVTITEEKTSCTSTAIARTNGTTNFHGIRKDVTAEELLKCKIIDQKQYEDLRTGKVTIQSLSEIDSVHTYLQGTNSIAGVFLQSSKQVLSICEAKLKGLLTPGTALVLLEAQAATGFMIDPVTNRKLSVEEAVTSGLVGADLKQKLLSAERGVTGYIDPNTGDTISLFQALQKELIVKDHGIRLLEAQIATGGIIDPVFSHRVPVEVAYQRGYFDEKMNQILLDPSDDTKGFFDPNTQENLTYLQLVERCVTDPKTGLSLLVIVQKGEDYFFFDEKTKKLLKSTIATKTEGKTNGQGLSVWEFLYSKHITEEKRRELVRQYSSGEITMEHLIKIIVTITEEKTSCTSTAIARTNGTTNFHGIRKDVTAEELLKCKIIDQKQYEDLRTGKVTIQSLSEIDSVHTYLQGTNSIAGVFLQSSKQVLSICEAKLKGLLTPGTALVLLEAQAATGFMIDPVTNRKLSVEEAVTSGLVGADLKQKLLSAERGVTGYTDPNTGDTISLFQALQKELIVKDHGIRLLEAQIATGGIIDPVFSHRVPVEVAYQRGYFDEKMNQILLDPSDDTKGFFDPNTQENLTYLQLVERCVTDPKTGLSLLVIVQKGEDYFFFDEKTKKLLKSTIATKTEGKTNGQGLSVWEFLYSKHITEEKRRELVRQYSSGEITMEHLIKIIVTITEEKTSCTSTAIARTNGTTNFHGIRKDVTAEELLKCKIIDQKQYEDLRTGKVTIQSLSEIDSVHTYLQGTNSIAGVFLQSSKQVLSICEAKLKGLLTPGTALVLLEAQAATGFMIDPVKNRKLSVEEAVISGLVGADLKQKLLSAERGVTGYTDPNTGDTISLFQALQKELIVKDHGIRLLEAQIATGGIIDPVFSHRVPVEVAYQRGYFDEKMNQILLDPSDDTKGFFDPNTQENLTYLQLVDRCVTDPNTGLCLLLLNP
ncbi:epiplakin-like [Conger conger]|uniref:epiplakin-like n=1 Tax=Conger conger TaxID=82655 RepID=UPI002A59CCC3|nr:epiplakin-like [Conger conger]